ncbi:MAG: helix-turn-helix domain-containing protein, partial [Candidatus Neomarinimicrobiota bacterium]
QALKLLLNYDYPGNVRELLNIIISSCTQELGEVLTVQSLPNYLTNGKTSKAGSIPIKALNMKKSRQYVLSLFEEKFVRHLLQHTAGNVTHAAKYAGLQRQSFQRLMRRYGVRSGDYTVKIPE